MEGLPMAITGRMGTDGRTVRSGPGRGRRAVVLVGAALALGASACSSTTTTAASTPTTTPGTAVHLRSDESSSGARSAVALWSELDAQGIPATVTGYDNTGRFSLSTPEPARLREAVAALASRPGGELRAYLGSTAGACPTASSATGGTTPPGPTSLPAFGLDRCFDVGPVLTAVHPLLGPSRHPETRDFVVAEVSEDLESYWEPCDQRSDSCPEGRLAVVDRGEVVGVFNFDGDRSPGLASDPTCTWLTADSPGTKERIGQRADRVAVTYEEIPDPPKVQAAPGNDRLTKVLQSAQVLEAGTDPTQLVSDGRIHEVEITADDRPATAVSSTGQVGGKVMAADFGPGLVLVDEMFSDPGVVDLPLRSPSTPFDPSTLQC
jgi:hypothetical protein